MDIVVKNNSEDFFEQSSKCLMDMLDTASSTTDPSRVLREIDAYRHLQKLQILAMTSSDPNAKEMFFKEVYNRRFAVSSSGEQTSTPSEQQISEFRTHVSKWFQLDSEIKELQDLLKDKRTVKNKIRDIILSFMKRYNIEELRTQNGKLRFETRSVNRFPSKTEIKENMQLALRDMPDLAEELHKKVFVSGRIDKVSLKRVK